MRSAATPTTTAATIASRNFSLHKVLHLVRFKSKESTFTHAFVCNSTISHKVWSVMHDAWYAKNEQVTLWWQPLTLLRTHLKTNVGLVFHCLQRTQCMGCSPVSALLQGSRRVTRTWCARDRVAVFVFVSFYPFWSLTLPSSIALSPLSFFLPYFVI